MLTPAEKSARQKSLKIRLSKLKIERGGVISAIEEMQKESKQKQKLINSLQTELNDIANPRDIIISEHAVLRYLERVEGMNMEELYEKILPASKKETLIALGNCKFKQPTHNLIIKNGTVVTIEERK